MDRYVDTLAGVKVLMCNTNARRTNYRSRVWEAFWDGLDPEGPDDQPFLKPMAPAEVARYRQMVESMRALHQQGVDYPARVAARCRQRGISPWISLRMNDVHNNDVLDHPFHGRFWVQNPSFFRQGATGYFANALDYAHPEVRDLYRRLIEESLTYDVDGIELDFMREPHVFSPGQEAAGHRCSPSGCGRSAASFVTPLPNAGGRCGSGCGCRLAPKRRGPTGSTRSAGRKRGWWIWWCQRRAGRRWSSTCRWRSGAGCCSRIGG